VEGTINITLRPIKIAFLVNPNDQGALKTAIELNTLLWGGIYNPIIPTYKRRPSHWKKRTSRKASEILEGYLDAFDPDFVIPLGNYQGQSFYTGGRKQISIQDLFLGYGTYSITGYGINIFDVMRHINVTELKYIRKNPLEFQLPIIGNKHNIFLSSIFGSLPKEAMQTFMKDYFPLLGMSDSHCDLNNYTNFLKRSNIFLRRISSYGLRVSYNRRFYKNCIFFLDANNSLDIIDYWNLRAVGWLVFLVPKQGCNSTEVKDFMYKVIESNYMPDKYNPEMYNYTKILKSQSCSEEEVRTFIESLKLPSVEKSSNSKYYYSFSYPRMWDEWARSHDDVEPSKVVADFIDYDISNFKKDVQIRTLDPKIMYRSSGMNARFANEIQHYIYGSSDLFAEVIPQSKATPLKSIRTIDHSSWRFSKRGIVYLSSHKNWSINFTLPKSENLIIELLESEGWNIKLSTPGRIAKRMVTILGGLYGISLLADRVIIDLLEELKENKHMSEEAIMAKFSIIVNQRQYPFSANEHLKKYIKAKILRLGVELQCPFCGQKSWYGVGEVDYRLNCPKCLDRFEIPSHSPKDIIWSYEAYGPFNLPNRSHGTFSVLLTLRFLSKILHGATSPILSIEGRKGGNKFEADLCMLYRDIGYSSSTPFLIFSECKSFNSFKPSDMRRMRLITKQFEGSVIVFSTLKDSLTNTEKKLLRPFVNRCRRYWKAERPYNPVLILTGNELFADRPPPRNWEDLSDIHQKFALSQKNLSGLLELCDATQQLYLDMDPWHSWLMDRWKKRDSN